MQDSVTGALGSDTTPPSEAPTEPGSASPLPPPRIPRVIPPVIGVDSLDWDQVRAAADPAAVRARMHRAVEALELLLDAPGGPRMLFDADRGDLDDRAIQVGASSAAGPLWVVGDLHGDLLALEGALAQIRAHDDADAGHGAPARIVFLGDFFDDEGYGLEVLVRVFELILAMPGQVCTIAGNHDEALGFDGSRFSSSVSPSDFADQLNANLAHEWMVRTAKLAIRLTARAPRALFFPHGLLIAHGGFPLSDLHGKLEQTGDWNDPAVLADFVWARAHPKARLKMPNRFSRGSQFGWQDFANFCALATRLGRPVTHMVRGHDHPDERYAVYPAYNAHPLVTTVALSRRLPREQFGPQERAPTLVRVSDDGVPQILQLHFPPGMVSDYFPERAMDAGAAAEGDEPS